MPFLENQDLIFLSTSLMEKSKEFKELVYNQIYIKSCFLNVISEMMERELYQYISIFESELEKLLTPYDVFEKLLLQKSISSFRQEEKIKKRLKISFNLLKYWITLS